MVVCPQLPFEVECHDITKLGYQFCVNQLQVQAIPVEHRIPCVSYHLILPRPGKFDPMRAKEKNIPVEYWAALQRGENIYDGDRVLRYVPADVLGAPRRGLKITYATDCRPSDALVALAKDSDLFVAEGLYGDPEKQPSAAEKGHMVYTEAAEIAKKANVKTLWLTHYSPAMQQPEEYLPLAQSIFSKTVCGENLLTTTLRFTE